MTANKEKNNLVITVFELSRYANLVYTCDTSTSNKLRNYSSFNVTTKKKGEG